MKFLESLKNWAFFILLFSFIYYLSSQPQQSALIPLIPFKNGDKAIHMGLYCFLGWSLSYALYEQHRWFRLNLRWMIVCFFLAPFIALFDEWHQSWVLGRSSDFVDGVFDVLGMAVAGLTFELKRLTTHKKRFLPLPQMRKNIFWYRLNFLWLFILMGVWQLYFISYDVSESTMTTLFSFNTFLNIWVGCVSSLMGLLWGRYCLFELWWQNQSENRMNLIQGWVLGLVITMGVCAFNLSVIVYSALGYTLCFGAYQYGLKWLKNLPKDSKVATTKFVC